MEVQVFLIGPDTLHAVMVRTKQEEDPQRALLDAQTSESAVVTIGGGAFRTDRIAAIVVR